MENGGQLPRLMTTRMLSTALGLPIWRLNELALGSKGPPFIRIGRTRRYPEDAVRRWIEEQAHNHEEEK